MIVVLDEARAQLDLAGSVLRCVNDWLRMTPSEPTRRMGVSLHSASAIWSIQALTAATASVSVTSLYAPTRAAAKSVCQ